MSTPFRVLAAGLTFVCLLSSSCRKPVDESGAAAEPPPVEVTVAPVEQRTFSDRSIAIGNLQSAESVEISTSVTERIETLHFDDGQFVEKGEILAVLDQAEETAMIEIAAAELAEEQREIQRLEGLADTRAVAEVTLEARRTAGEIASGRIAQAQARKEERTIRAPFSGRVGIRRISPGALVEPGTVITTFDQIETMKLDFTVPAVFLSQLRPGESLTATTRAFPGETFSAEVATIDSRVDPVTRSVLVRAILPNRDHRLRPGMLMTVELQRNERSTLAIPERAIVPRGQARSVYVVQGDTVEFRQIETGSRIPGYVEVLSGLTEEDRVVSDGLLALQNGARIEVAGVYSEPTPVFDPREQAGFRNDPR